MSLPHDLGHHDHGDDELVRYLLKLLPDEDAERLDEASVVDDEVSARLRIVENDLVDAYVSGALAGDRRERFESYYLSSPRRQERVRFAQKFLRAVDRAAAPAGTQPEHEAMRASASVHDEPPRPDRASRVRTMLRSKLGWTLAAVAAVLVIACGTLLFQAARLQNGLIDARRQSDTLERRTRELAQQLDEQRTANAVVVKELERVRESAALASPPAAAAPPVRPGTARETAMTALVLLPQTRAIGPIPAFGVPPGLDHVAFELRLESNDFPRYQVGLKDPASNQIVWRSGWLTTSMSGDRPSVSVLVPASRLRQQHYALDLIGREAAGRADVVGSYAFRIVPR